MERISVFDIFKIGIGPSSSHTMGPWRAAEKFLARIDTGRVSSVEVSLYGSLAKTGFGHGTDIAVMLGLSGYDPVTIPLEEIDRVVDTIRQEHILRLNGHRPIPFFPDMHIVLHFERLPFHPNGISFDATLADGSHVHETYYSIGGGFVIQEYEHTAERQHIILHYPIDREADLRKWISKTGLPVSSIVMENEKCWRPENAVREQLLHLWDMMQHAIYTGCQTGGILPGGLDVHRRAQKISQDLLGHAEKLDKKSWLEAIRTCRPSFENVTRWVSCFALSVNEVNASFGRIVTAPTNGAAGVIPAVLMYYLYFHENAGEEDIVRFLLTAGEIGSLFKKGSTISAALGGCQAEIGVSSSMAAAGLTECMGGTPSQVLMAAEIAMEHHLGMTCDPVGGLVQIPCIERNTMGAIKAIMACQIALGSEPGFAKVNLDSIIKTMWETAKDMSDKYKETADGGLALNISVRVAEC